MAAVLDYKGKKKREALQPYQKGGCSMLASKQSISGTARYLKLVRLESTTWPYTRLSSSDSNLLMIFMFLNC